MTDAGRSLRGPSLTWLQAAASERRGWPRIRAPGDFTATGKVDTVGPKRQHAPATSVRCVLICHAAPPLHLQPPDAGVVHLGGRRLVTRPGARPNPAAISTFSRGISEKVT